MNVFIRHLFENFTCFIQARFDMFGMKDVTLHTNTSTFFSVLHWLCVFVVCIFPLSFMLIFSIQFPFIFSVVTLDSNLHLFVVIVQQKAKKRVIKHKILNFFYISAFFLAHFKSTNKRNPTTAKIVKLWHKTTKPTQQQQQLQQQQK